MNEEQKARIANLCEIESRMPSAVFDEIYPNCRWLLALVKELDEKLSLSIRNEEVGHRTMLGVVEANAQFKAAAERAEQQLAAVTAEHDRRVGDLQRMTAERDELKREMERLKGYRAQDVATLYLANERIEKVEAERDALRGVLEFYVTNDDDGYRAKHTLRRLKGEKGGG